MMPNSRRQDLKFVLLVQSALRDTNRMLPATVQYDAMYGSIPALFDSGAEHGTRH
jgi:hypothetical protein